MERCIARSLVTAVLACAGSSIPASARACICVHDTVTLVLASGRVFNLDGPAGAEAVPDATVELQRIRDSANVATTTTDADGVFELKTPPPGEYQLRVSLPGFQSTAFRVRIKKGQPDAAGRLLVRIDGPGAYADCTCGDACVAKSDRSGRVEPTCLVERSKETAPLPRH